MKHCKSVEILSNFQNVKTLLQQRGGCYMRSAKNNIPSSTKATGSYL